MEEEKTFWGTVKDGLSKRLGETTVKDGGFVTKLSTEGAQRIINAPIYQPPKYDENFNLVTPGRYIDKKTGVVLREESDYDIDPNSNGGTVLTTQQTQQPAYQASFAPPAATGPNNIMIVVAIVAIAIAAALKFLKFF